MSLFDQECVCLGLIHTTRITWALTNRLGVTPDVRSMLDVWGGTLVSPQQHDYCDSFVCRGFTFRVSCDVDGPDEVETPQTFSVWVDGLCKHCRHLIHAQNFVLKYARDPFYRAKLAAESLASESHAA